jgi:hypothetical protein
VKDWEKRRGKEIDRLDKYRGWEKNMGETRDRNRRMKRTEEYTSMGVRHEDTRLFLRDRTYILVYSKKSWSDDWTS